jgi:hypothetical protein
VFLIVVLAGVACGLVVLYPSEGVSWLTVGLVLVAALLVLGIADWMASKIVLGDDALDVVELFRRYSYARSQLVSVKVDGGRVCIERVDGGWVVLPDTGRNALGVCNSVRAWLGETA